MRLHLQNLNRILNSSHLVKVIMIVLLYLYTGKLTVILFGVLYLISCGHLREVAILIILLAALICRASFYQLIGDNFIVTSLHDSYLIAADGNYRIRVFTEKDYRIGDVIKTDNLIRYEKADNDILYYQYGDVSTVFHIPNLRNDLYAKLLMKDDRLSLFLKDILFDEFYGELELCLSWSFFYRILKDIFSWFTDRKKAAAAALFALFNLLGFDYVFLRIAAFECFGLVLKRKDLVLIYSTLTMIFISPSIIHSYSFIIPFIIRFVYLFKSDLSFRALIAIIQSLFFNGVNLVQVLFFSRIMHITFFLAFLGIADLYLPVLPLFVKNDLLVILDAFSNILQLRGRISLVTLILTVCGFKSFRIRSSFGQLSVIFLLIGSNISNIFGSVTFIDVGQGDAILIKAPFNSGTVLIDTGSEYNYYKLDRYLKSKGVYVIDYLIITHPDKDHSGNIGALFADYQINETIIEAQDISLCNLTFKNLNHSEYEDKNDNSLVYYLEFSDISFLFTGDISSSVEKELINNYFYLSPDVLKVSHHGSKTATSNYFLATFSFDLSVISTSGQYGHPHQEVVDRLNDWQIPILNTKDQGSIAFVFTNLCNFYVCAKGEFGIIN